jgi:hypothetical protein
VLGWNGDVSSFGPLNVGIEAWASKTFPLGRANTALDYDKFKSKVAHHQGSEGAAYEHSLHDVWSVMNKLQK